MELTQRCWGRLQRAGQTCGAKECGSMQGEKPERWRRGEGGCAGEQGRRPKDSEEAEHQLSSVYWGKLSSAGARQSYDLDKRSLRGPQWWPEW
jgi:hypothetical protein